RAVVHELLDPDQLDALFELNSVEQYERMIPFYAVVYAMAELALGTISSKNQAYKKYQQEIAANKAAFYNKLNRTEPGISEALVRFSATKVGALLKQLDFQPWEVLPGYRCYSLDGNHFKKSQRRLKEARLITAPPLPGSVVAKYDHQSGLFSDAYALECGHAQEASLVDRIIADSDHGDLYIADRHYCTKRFVFGLINANCFFVVRQKMTFTGKLVGKRQKVGHTETGMVFEQAVVINRGGETHTIRRITVELDEPTRDGETEIHLFTNAAAKTSALAIADAYRHRWEIETGFHCMTMTLCCESTGNCYPRCAILQFCMAMVAYNARRLLLASLYCVHEEASVDALSEYQVSLEVTTHMAGLCTAITEREWEDIVGTDGKSVCRFLLKIARRIDPKKYVKSTRGPKRPPPEKRKM
ncbi:MAG: transposase, partial [Planctomycetota bacterium]